MARSGGPLPASFAVAKVHLLPALRARIHAETTDRMVATSPMKSLAGRPMAEHLWLALVLARPGRHLQFVTEKNLSDWQVSFDDALATATDNLGRRSADDPVEVSPGFYAWHSDDGWAGSCMILTDRIRKLGVKGDPVVIAAAPGDLFIAGADDDAALEALAERAAEVVAHPRPISGIAFRLGKGGRWEPFRAGWAAGGRLQASSSDCRQRTGRRSLRSADCWAR